MTNEKFPLRYLNKYFIRYRKLFLGGILFVALANVFSVYSAVYVRKAFDVVAAWLKQPEASLKQPISEILLLYASIIFGAALVRGLFMYLMRQSLIVMSRHIEFDLKNEIYDQYQELDTAFYRKNNTGDLMNRISEDVSRIRMYVGPAIMYLVNLVVMFMIILITMLSVNVELTLWVIAPLPVLALSIYFVNDLIEKRSDASQEALSNITSFAQETFSGLRVIKSFAKERAVAESFEKEAQAYRDKALKLTLVDALWFPSILFMIGCSSILAVYIGGRQVIEGQITIGNIAEFIIYINMLSFPFASLGWAVSLIQRARASQRRINEFLYITPEITNEGIIPFKLEKKISFEHLYFSYPGAGVCALKDINFMLPAGSSLGIIGATGSGKSTLASLLLRLYEPDEGNIYIDEVPIKNIQLNDLRAKTGYVPQDVFLFSDSLKNNISFGKDDATEDEIIRAAKDAAIHENIMTFPEQYETLSGERGVMLSGGQKQRIAIARAFIRQPEILLLDDSLSAVDADTEAIILSKIRERQDHTTSIIISHRISSVMHCQQILVLDGGTITERGTHDELMKAGGYYKRMYEKQLSEENIIS